MSSSSSNPKRPIVFGEALVDVFREGDVAGGAPFNVARHLAALGLDPLFITRLGNDARGAALRAELERFGMDTAGLQTDAVYGTGVVAVNEQVPGVHSFRIENDRAWDHIDCAAAMQALDNQAGNAGLLYYGTLAQRSAPSRATIEALQAALPGLGWCDLNWRAGHVEAADAMRMVHAAAHAKVNEQELAMALGWAGLPSIVSAQVPTIDSDHPAIAAWLSQGSIATLIVTYGAAGYAAFDRAGTCIAAGSGLAVAQMVDTVGSGDAFTAIVLTGSLCGWPLDLTLSRANAFAAALCSVRGAAPESLAFYARWRQEWDLG